MDQVEITVFLAPSDGARCTLLRTQIGRLIPSDWNCREILLTAEEIAPQPVTADMTQRNIVAITVTSSKPNLVREARLLLIAEPVFGYVPHVCVELNDSSTAEEHETHVAAIMADAPSNTMLTFWQSSRPLLHFDHHTRLMLEHASSIRQLAGLLFEVPWPTREEQIRLSRSMHPL